MTEFLPLGQLVLALIVVGVLLYLLNRYLPMDPKVRQVLNILIAIVVGAVAAQRFCAVFG